MRYYTVTSTYEGCYDDCQAPCSEKCIDKNYDQNNKHAVRKATPVFTGVLKYFPDALKYVAKASAAGNTQHNNGDELFWDRSKSGDELDALTRHLIDHSLEPMDDDGILHLGKVAWRALAALQKHLEINEDERLP